MRKWNTGLMTMEYWHEILFFGEVPDRRFDILSGGIGVHGLQVLRSYTMSMASYREWKYACRYLAKRFDGVVSLKNPYGILFMAPLYPPSLEKAVARRAISFLELAEQQMLMGEQQ